MSGYLAEDQAKGKFCCGPEGCGYVTGHGDRICRGSACMAWRWSPLGNKRRAIIKEWPGFMDLEMAKEIGKEILSEAGPVGYCALTTKPEGGL